MIKIGVFGALMAILYLPVAAYAQDLGGSVKSIEDIPDGTIVVISKEETGIPGYLHEKYVFVDSNCPGGLEPVDYYGPAIDPNDPNLHMLERRVCASLRLDVSDGD